VPPGADRESAALSNHQICLQNLIGRDNGAKKLRGNAGGKTTQKGENAQPLIDH